MDNFLSELPLQGITKYSKSISKEAISFTGYPRQHPSEKNKVILVNDPLGIKPLILEFKIEDVLFVEETHQAVTESGEGILMVKMWIRKGSHAMILEPFEVTEDTKIADKVKIVKTRLDEIRKEGMLGSNY